MHFLSCIFLLEGRQHRRVTAMDYGEVVAVNLLQHLYGLQVIILQDSALLVAAATRPLSAHLFPSAPLCWCDTLLTLPDQVCHLLGVFLG